MPDETPLRADARRNRERLLAAAQEVFLERGAGASMEEIAKRAGVGIGTLYRRFPTRESLLAAAYSARFLALAAGSRARSGNAEPLDALRAYLHDLVVQTSAYRGIPTFLGPMLQDGTPGCDATCKEGRRLLRRAQSSGAVRRDVTFEDLVAIAVATGLATEQTASPASRATHLLSLFLDGIRSQAPSAGGLETPAGGPGIPHVKRRSRRVRQPAAGCRPADTTAP